jgi:hypothetical protein
LLYWYKSTNTDICRQDKHAWVREAALKALEIIAKEADEQSVNAATRNLQVHAVPNLQLGIYLIYC